MDSLHYAYQGNQLLAVEDLGIGTGVAGDFQANIGVPDATQ